MLQPLLQAARNNSPGAKPELWRHLPLALFRNIQCRFGVTAELRSVLLEDGVRIRVDLRTGMGTSIYVYKCWEHPVTELLRRALRPGMCFFDVGANIGYYSLIAAARCRQVFAFEPVPSIFQSLQSNVILNPGLKISTHNVALARETAAATFFVVHDPKNQGLSSLHASPGAQQITVPSKSLDDFLEQQRIERIDVMKVDVEGAEEEVFEGGTKVLSSQTAPDIVFECHPGAKSDERLRGFGYRIYEFHGQRRYEARNLFATKQKLPANIAPLLR